jgi:arylsulfatase A-like enzyme
MIKPFQIFYLLFISSLSFGANKPNIILIYTDDQGYGDFSLLNPDSKFKTPNLDRLAKEGITLTDGHSPDTVCPPFSIWLAHGQVLLAHHAQTRSFRCRKTLRNDTPIWPDVAHPVIQNSKK